MTRLRTFCVHNFGTRQTASIPMTSERQQRAVERILEDKGSTGNLTDQPARYLNGPAPRRPVLPPIQRVATPRYTTLSAQSGARFWASPPLLNTT
ncbi:MAG: hypothetical protein MI924_14210 [Chloroflexales bacterium]|nr:hypothetical protein [Chloroflexales bacterium]